MDAPVISIDGVKILGLLLAQEASGLSEITFIIGQVEGSDRYYLYLSKKKRDLHTVNAKPVIEPGGSFTYTASVIKYVRDQVRRSHLVVIADTLDTIDDKNAKVASHAIMPTCYEFNAVTGGGKGMEACGKCRFVSDCGNPEYTAKIPAIESDEDIIARIKVKMGSMPWKD